MPSSFEMKGLCSGKMIKKTLFLSSRWNVFLHFKEEKKIWLICSSFKWGWNEEKRSTYCSDIIFKKNPFRSFCQSKKLLFWRRKASLFVDTYYYLSRDRYKHKTYRYIDPSHHNFENCIIPSFSPSELLGRAIVCTACLKQLWGGNHGRRQFSKL